MVGTVVVAVEPGMGEGRWGAASGGATVLLGAGREAGEALDGGLPLAKPAPGTMGNPPIPLPLPTIRFFFADFCPLGGGGSSSISSLGMPAT